MLPSTLTNTEGKTNDDDAWIIGAGTGIMGSRYDYNYRYHYFRGASDSGDEREGDGADRGTPALSPGGLTTYKRREEGESRTVVNAGDHLDGHRSEKRSKLDSHHSKISAEAEIDARSTFLAWTRSRSGGGSGSGSGTSVKFAATQPAGLRELSLRSEAEAEGEGYMMKRLG